MRNHTAQITRQALLDAALVVLECERGEFTLEAVAAQARVSKGGLLHHFATKRDLLRSWTQEVGTLLDTGAVSLEDPRVNAGSDEYLPAVVVSIFEHIATHAPYYRLMLGRHGLSSIASDIESQVIQFLERRADLFTSALPVNGAPISMRTRAYAAQFVGIVKWWLEQDVLASPEQMAVWTWDLPIRLEL